MAYRSALITGASGGIGEAFANALPSATGLLLTGRDETRLAEVAAASAAAPGRRVETLAADLATAEGRHAVVRAAEAAEVDLFICNAGFGHAGRFGATDASIERALIAVNVMAAAELLHALLPGIAERARRTDRRGGVIVVSSAVALGPSPHLATYGAAKAFQLHLTRSLAREFSGEAIDFLALCPTYTRTGFFARAGMPPPPVAMSPAAVAREGLAALGRRQLHLCGSGLLPQSLRRFLAFNRALDPRAWRRS